MTTRVSSDSACFAALGNCVLVCRKTRCLEAHEDEIYATKKGATRPWIDRFDFLSAVKAADLKVFCRFGSANFLEPRGLRF